MSDSTVHTVTIEHEGYDPVTVTATVVTVERREEPNSYSGTRLGLDAELRVAIRPDRRPDTYFLSQLVGERAWVIDAHITGNGVPIHSNGFGARYLRVSAIAPELAVLLDREAQERCLVAAIGPDVPLELA